MSSPSLRPSIATRLMSLILALGLTLGAAAAESRRVFNIAADAAERTLPLLARQSGTEVIFSTNAAAGVRTNAVNGEMTATEALTTMLAGTPLVMVRDEKNGVLRVTRATSPSASPNAPGTPRTDPARPNSQSAKVDEPVQAMDVMEVAVTVQKRRQLAQEVPISMTTLPARSVERFKIETLRDLSRLAPNLLVSSFSQINPTIAIRGATNTFNQIGLNKPVAVVIDDVYMPRNTAASFELFDLSSVQVLRGPQGTLFGRNVTGGAIVLNTLQPSFTDREGAARVEFGNYSDRRFEAMYSSPITSDVAGKFSLSRHTHNGYGYDRLTGREQDDQDSGSVRGQLRAKLSSQLTAAVSADYSDDRNGGRTLSSRGLGADNNRRTSELGYPQSYARTMWGVSGRLNLRLGSGDFESITAYRESKSGEDYSGVGTSYTFLTAGSQSVTRDVDHPGTFTQELRYASPKWPMFDFVAGLYYLNEDAYRNLVSRAFAARTGAVVTHQIADQKVETRSFAGYFDANLHFGPQFTLTLGGRQTADRKEASLVRTDLIVPANNFTSRGLHKSWTEFTPRAVLAWSPDKIFNAYASVTKGYTAGGYNTEAATIAILTTPFDPETITNYEVGIKSDLWRRRLRLNVAAFDQRYRDKQELYFNTITRILTIVNASRATMKGLEAEALLIPVEGLTVSAGYGRLNASYDTFVVPNVLNYTGNPLGSSPRNKYSCAAEYEWRVREAGFVTLMGAWSKTDGYYTGATKDPNLYVPGYSLVNASVGFETRDRRWRVRVWGRNLGDREYLLTPSTQVVLSEYLGEPRTYGVTVGLRF